MSILVDTSAFLAILNKEDPNNASATELLASFVEDGEELFCTNYILVESYALIQRRLGMDAIRDFQKEILPSIKIVWLGLEEHKHIVARLISDNRRNLSFVDCSSFETLERLGIKSVFTFDRHFREQGFDVIPEVF